MDAWSQRFVGWYEIVGAVTVLLSTGVLLAKTAGGLWLLMPALCFVTLASAGILLVRGHRAGKRLSIVAQAIQLPKLFTVPISYELYGPLTVSLGLKPDYWSLSLGFELGGGFSFALGREPCWCPRGQRGCRCRAFLYAAEAQG